MAAYHAAVGEETQLNTMNYGRLGLWPGGHGRYEYYQRHAQVKLFGKVLSHQPGEQRHSKCPSLRRIHLAHDENVNSPTSLWPESFKPASQHEWMVRMKNDWNIVFATGKEVKTAAGPYISDQESDSSLEWRVGPLGRRRMN